MKMRASLARSLVLDPKVFLFDEPFGAVDEITRERLNDEVIALFQRKGFAGLFITHSICEAVFLSTRVLVMIARPGRIVGDFAVPFAYPRSPDLRFEPEFAELCGEVSARAARSPRMSTVDVGRRHRRRSTLRSPLPPATRPPVARTARSPGVALSQIIGPRRRCSCVFIGLWYLMHYWGLRCFFDKPAASCIPIAGTRVDQSRSCDRSPAAATSSGIEWTTFVALDRAGRSRSCSAWRWRS